MTRGGTGKFCGESPADGHVVSLEALGPVYVRAGIITVPAQAAVMYFTADLKVSKRWRWCVSRGGDGFK